MGGGSDSRIPSILKEYFSHHDRGSLSVRVICHTYSFDPEVARRQVESWLEQYDPDLIIGESLGSLHALRIHDRPVLLVSPALNASIHLTMISWLVLIPRVSDWFQRIYRPREGDRQQLNFTHSILRKYRSHGRKALEFRKKSSCEVHAFLGLRDHYRKIGVVSIRRWKRLFGDTFTLYDGTHYMEEEYVLSLLIPKIKSFQK